MPKLLKNIGRMFISLRNIFHKLFGVATDKTGSMFKTLGATIGTALAVVLSVVIMLLIVVVSIPIVAFIGRGEEENVIHIKPVKITP